MLKIKISKAEFEAKYNTRYVELPKVDREKYLVSDCGDIFRVDKFDGSTLSLSQLETRGAINHAGMTTVRFSSELYGITAYRTAFVVASAFVDGYTKEKNMLLFKDGNKLNVCADNLAWVSYSEVMKYYYDRKLNRNQDYVLTSNKQKSEEIEKALEAEDAKLEEKPCDEAVWEGDELGWVVYSKEHTDEELEQLAKDSEYELSEEEWKKVDREANKQLRLGYKYGNSAIKEKKKQVVEEDDGEF